MSLSAMARRVGLRLPRLTRYTHSSPVLHKQQRRQVPFKEYNGFPSGGMDTRDAGTLTAMENHHQTPTEKYSRSAFGLRPDVSYDVNDSSLSPSTSTSTSGSDLADKTPKDLATNWRAAKKRFQLGENPMEGLHSRKFGEMGKGKKRRGYMGEAGEPLTPAMRAEQQRERELRERRKSVGFAETDAEAAERASNMSQKGAKKWNPRKKLSFAAMDGLRELHLQDPEGWPAEKLSETFGVSYEAVKRVLKSKYRGGDSDDASGSGGFATPASATPKNRPKGLNSTIPDAHIRGDAAAGKWAQLSRDAATTTGLRKWNKANLAGPEGQQFKLAEGSPAERVRRAYDLRREMQGTDADAQLPVPTPRRRKEVERTEFERKPNRAERRASSFGLKDSREHRTERRSGSFGLKDRGD